MDLRPGLNFPSLDEGKVRQLAQLATKLKADDASDSLSCLNEFNQGAGTKLSLEQFNQAYGSTTDKVTWVRNVLCEVFVALAPHPTMEESLEIITRLATGQGEEQEQFFWMRIMERYLDPRISDLIHWPNEYFGDSSEERKLTPQQMLDTVWRK